MESENIALFRNIGSAEGVRVRGNGMWKRTQQDNVYMNKKTQEGRVGEEQ